MFATSTLATADPADDTKAVRAVLDAQLDAWNDGNLAAFMDGYRNDDQLLGVSGGTVVKGWEALNERYTTTYRGDGKEMGRLSFTSVTVEYLGPDTAVVPGRWELTTTKETTRGWFTQLHKKFAGGWKITYDHTSR